MKTPANPAEVELPSAEGAAGCSWLPIWRRRSGLVETVDERLGQQVVGRPAEERLADPALHRFARGDQIVKVLF